MVDEDAGPDRSSDRSTRWRLRSAEARDRNRVYDICLRTGAAGADATGLVTLPDLLGDLFAGPYIDLEPQSGLVLAGDDDQAVGYVLAAADTRAFEADCDERWWPAARRRHPLGAGTTPLDRLLVDLVHSPPRADPGVVERYPSHLHIDLLPEVQGQGWGRRMVEACWSQLAAGGSPGLHLGTSQANARSHVFYESLGMALHSSDAMSRTYVIAF